MFSKAILSSFLFLIAINSYAQTDTGEKASNKLIKVSNKIYMMQGNGGNIGLSVGNDGVFMIDDQFAEEIEQIQKDIKKISDKPVRFLVNTHFHGDHTGGNAGMAKSGTVLFSHENVRKRLLEVMRKETKKMPEDALPLVTFSEDLTFHFNGEKIYVFHVHNAHTDGDAMIYFTDSNVLHTGDVFFNGKYPFIDEQNGGSLMGNISAMEKALNIINEDTKIIPGHGNIATFKDLQTGTNMLTTVYKRVYTHYANKKSEEEVAKMTDITQEYDAKGYGSGFISTDAFLRMVYKNVAEERNSIDSNAEKNRKAREKVEKMMKEQEQKEKN
ncbi:MBL fold metallo-hydrolase [Aequorivita sp. SDUM287046]|uniref:MBL fold metallo-hydrolase n=1 Tax=Aequorivita aurantiaca TaxID=3053356 RepID=A0ABT8DJR2_9FLAO|nr:MBL fold metallo-hydrolase [Aequorivita aurantiaca]MDN3723380.1 MBL fold metallo-hydrolase [Aequorivita aurantiaca]